MNNTDDILLISRRRYVRQTGRAPTLR